MKNLFLTTLTLLFFTTLANAQLGIRLGANLANYSSSVEEVEFKSKVGFSAGVFYKLKAGESLTIQPELNFVQQGTKFSIDFLGTTAESTLSVNYLQVPVLLKYGFGDVEKTNFFIQAGPYFGYGIGKPKAKSCVGEECETEDGEFSDEDGGLKQTDFGVLLGLGININSNISIDARYGLGLSNTVSGDSDDESVKNTAINIGIGYTF